MWTCGYKKEQMWIYNTCGYNKGRCGFIKQMWRCGYNKGRCGYIKHVDITRVGVEMWI